MISSSWVGNITENNRDIGINVSFILCLNIEALFS